MLEVIVKINLSLIVIFGIYMVFLAKTKQLKTKRFFLLFGLILSITLPFLPHLFTEETQVISASLPTINFISANTIGNFASSNIFWVLYGAVAFLVFSYFLIGIHKVLKFISNSRRVDFNGKEVYFSNESNVCFNFFSFIVISKGTPKELLIIQLNHELVHKNQVHSLDILIIEIFKIFFWFNPIIYAYKNEIIQNHEFLADTHASKNNIGIYQKWLLQKINPNYHTLFASQFFSKSLIKNRINMLHKKSTFNGKLRTWFAIPLAVITMVIVSCTGNAFEPNQTILDGNPIIKNEQKNVSEKLPQFPGGMNKLLDFFNENMVYPEALESDSIEGKTIISFVVDKNGGLSSFEVLKSDHELFSEAGLEIVKAMPNWTPGEKDGNKVTMKMTLPIAFKLK